MWRNTQAAYGYVTRILHWLIALLIAGQIGLGFLTQTMANNPLIQFSLYQWHKSLGFLILGLALIRMVWFAASIYPSPSPGVNQLEWRVAKAVHRLLLVMTILVPVTGWAIVSTSPLGIPSYVFDLFVMPNMPLPVSEADEALWSWLHAICVYGIIGLVALHAAAALYHHFIRRDETLRRMIKFPHFSRKVL
ncbi:cytochrome b [Ochrobactrum sp. GPK 3]|uniref:cytochrome b n=1 Tax=Brucella sp. 22210 TaxID=3453892 RepID=UPI0031384B7B